MHTLAEVWKNLEGRVVAEKFPLRQRLGGSEHGSVFLSERVANGSRPAAIKLISAEGVFSSQVEEDAQLSRWADAAKLSHPHLLRVFESGRCQVDGVRFLYVVMEYAEENLGQILPQRPLSPEEASELIPPTAEALAFLHSAGYAHGRLKPGNMFAVENQLKISADSLRKTGERDERELSVYDAPEIARQGVSPAGDVWSLGAMLVAVLTQHEPDTKRAEHGQIGIADTIPEPFHEIAQRCLQLDPQQRATLEEIVGSFGVEEPVGRPLDGVRDDTANDNGSTSIRRREVASVKRPLLRGFMAALVISAIVIAALLCAIWLGRKLTAQHPAISATPSPSTEAPSVPANVSSNQSPAPASAPSTEKVSPVGTGKVRGRVLKQVLPEVSRAGQNTIHGRVKVSVRVSVDASGNVSHASFASAGPSKYFAKQALAAVRGWKFTPPQIDGQASPSEWLLRFEFGRKETQVFPAEIKP